VRRLVLVPNNMGSRAARNLANTLSEKLNYRVLRVRPHRVGKRMPVVLHRGTDKLTQFQRFKEYNVPSPEFTTEHSVALDWVRSGTVVVCRRLLNASEGRGIVIADKEEDLVYAPLYTKYCPKLAEYRVHVAYGKVIDVQQKRKRAGVLEEGNSRIRNLANHYVFCRAAIVEPPKLQEVALSAVAALGYSIGAVDIVHNVKKELLLVLEVNACPGMEGTTVERYADTVITTYKAEGRSSAKHRRMSYVL
jgi:hypothetical protein